MTMIRAITRSRPLLEPKKDVSLAMTKWWKKQRPAEGEITMHLSPYEQEPIVPWLKTFRKKMIDRIPTYMWPFGTFAFIYGVVVVAEAVDHQEDYDHRF